MITNLIGQGLLGLIKKPQLMNSLLAGGAATQAVNQGLLSKDNLINTGNFLYKNLQNPSIGAISENINNFTDVTETPSGIIYQPSGSDMEREAEYNRGLGTNKTFADDIKSEPLITPEAEKLSGLLSTPEVEQIDYSNVTPIPESSKPSDFITNLESDNKQPSLLLDRPSLVGVVDQEQEVKPSDLLNIYEVNKSSEPTDWVDTEILKVENNKPVYKKIAYGYHNPPEDYVGSNEDYFNDMVNSVVKETRDLYSRSDSGDKDAIGIIKQKEWFDSQVKGGRQEQGGMLDFFADTLGTTSANTNVRDNFAYAGQILENYSKGKYDKVIEKYIITLEKENITPYQYANKHMQIKNKNGAEAAQKEYPLIRKINEDGSFGALFGMNSPPTMAVFMDTFRVLKHGGKAKTINYTQNLAGAGDYAVIDLWMGRNLRRLSGRGKIPIHAEQGVSGNVLKDNKTVGGEYGFGQKVYNEAANKLKETGVEIDTKQLQALNWITEKELWAKNGWSPASGGSIEFERKFFGLPEELQAEVTKNRKIIDSSKSTVDEKSVAVANLDELAKKAGTDLFSVGLSGERPLLEQTSEQALDIKQNFINLFKDDSQIRALKAVPTTGRIMGDGETSVDIEFQANKNYDISKVVTKAVELAKKYDQDSVFVSRKVLDKNYQIDKNKENLRPGAEIYFTEKYDEAAVDKIIKDLDTKKYPGFTFVKDMRVQDNVNPILGFTGRKEYVGIRAQYIPEFDGYENYNELPKEEKDKLFEDQLENYSNLIEYIKENHKGISFSDVFFYDTMVILRDKYNEYVR